MTFNLQEMKSTLTMDKKIVLGFKQQSGHGDTLHTLHNAESGWPIRTPVAPAFISVSYTHLTLPTIYSV